jgi:hypothetical protein
VGKKAKTIKAGYLTTSGETSIKFGGIRRRCGETCEEATMAFCWKKVGKEFRKFRGERPRHE